MIVWTIAWINVFGVRMLDDVGFVIDVLNLYLSF